MGPRAQVGANLRKEGKGDAYGGTWCVSIVGGRGMVLCDTFAFSLWIGWKDRGGKRKVCAQGDGLKVEDNRVMKRGRGWAGLAGWELQGYEWNWLFIVSIIIIEHAECEKKEKLHLLSHWPTWPMALVLAQLTTYLLPSSLPQGPIKHF